MLISKQKMFLKKYFNFTTCFFILFLLGLLVVPALTYWDAYTTYGGHERAIEKLKIRPERISSSSSFKGFQGSDYEFIWITYVFLIIILAISSLKYLSNLLGSIFTKNPANKILDITPFNSEDG